MQGVCVPTYAQKQNEKLVVWDSFFAFVKTRRVGLVFTAYLLAICWVCAYILTHLTNLSKFDLKKIDKLKEYDSTKKGTFPYK